MTVSKATALLACLCFLVVGLTVTAQEDSGFEALLQDIGQPATDAAPAAADVTAPEAAVTEAVAAEAAAETATTEAVAAEAAAETATTEAVAAEAAAETATAEAVTAEAAAETATTEAVAAEAAAETAAVEAVAAEAAAETATAEAVAAAEADAPVAEPVVVEAPVMEEPMVEAPVVDMPVIEAPAAEPVVVDMPVEPAIEAPVMEEPVVVEAPVEMPMEEPVLEAPVMEEPTMDMPVAEEIPAMEMPAEEMPAEVAAEEPVAEQPKVAGKEKGKPASAKEAKAYAAQEEVRRQAMEVQGLKSLEQGYRALTANDFTNAVKQFEDALINLPERPATQQDRERAKWGHAEASYRIALDIYRKRGSMSEARAQTERALRMVPGYAPAVALLRKIEDQERVLALPVPTDRRPDVLERKKTVSELLTEGKEFYKIKDYNRSAALFEKVLIEDEYNVEAMRYLRKIDDVRYKLSTKEREATAAKMIRDVRDTWNPPKRDEVDLPEAVVRGSVVTTESGVQKLQKKMAKIMIPSIEFRQANITDVINFLVEASIAGDEEGSGVNIILNLSIPGQESTPAPVSAPAPDAFGGDIFGAPDAFGPAEATMAAPAGGSVRTITLNLRRISLLDAIKYITEVAGLKYRLEDNAIIITPANVVSGRVITRMYPVQPSILDVIVQREETDTSERTGEFVEMGGSRATIKRGEVKDFFEKAGVPFPVGTSITYNPTISQLIVANTPENLEVFERILTQLNVIPNQVEIEARFVEVAENDLEELGLQWILNDNYEFLQNQTGGPVGGRERVQVDADQDGLTKGLRFFSFDSSTASVDPASAVTRGVSQSALGGILSISSVLTNPEVTMVLQALSQKGNSDLLSAPRVTTRSGVNAQIQIVREIIYPTEFEVTQPTVQSQGDLVTPPTVTPGSFETREVGVILNVTPTVGPDGYTIDLTMVPEVAELVDWIQYGSSITIETGTVGARQERTFQYNIPQPVFSSRNATTSIVIWDGQTVVMGGLIREELVTIKDKVPFLGDIPVLGRLFRSEGQKSKKSNLLIFVTARLVDPAGKPIHRAEAMAMPGGGAQAQSAQP